MKTKSIDLFKLTPAPWVVIRETNFTIGMPVVRMYDDEDANLVVGHPADWGPTNNETDAEFIALARNALFVMTLRGWYPIPGVDKRWRVASKTPMDSPYDEGDNPLDGAPDYGDPFTALVEANKWYEENVEGKVGIMTMEELFAKTPEPFQRDSTTG